MLGSFLSGESWVKAVAEEVRARDEALCHLREHIIRALQSMTKVAKHWPDVQF